MQVRQLLLGVLGPSVLKASLLGRLPPDAAMQICVHDMPVGQPIPVGALAVVTITVLVHVNLWLALPCIQMFVTKGNLDDLFSLLHRFKWLQRGIRTRAPTSGMTPMANTLNPRRSKGRGRCASLWVCGCLGEYAMPLACENV